GGRERQNSVRLGLAWIAGMHPGSLVLIHDAARPFITSDKISRVIQGAIRSGAATCAVPVKDTIKRVLPKEDHGSSPSRLFVQETVPRAGLYHTQTPQAFRFSLVWRAHQDALASGYEATDDAGLMEWKGLPVEIVPGDYQNFKITTPDDLWMAESALGQKRQAGGEHMFRIGQGFDVHQLTEGRPLVLGGVVIPYDKGLIGHSDADVLLHAVKDALLGAIAAGDIGRHFPDTDEAYRGADSVKLLQEVWRMVTTQGYRLGNLDCTVMAQRPKLAPYIEEMRGVLAKELSAEPLQINIKATTTEQLGFIGRGEGIAAQAIVLLEKV
ncbi:MAG: ispD, partial [Bacilli bacterium]|nr:ispD [Bacilli bacterium]